MINYEHGQLHLEKNRGAAAPPSSVMISRRLGSGTCVSSHAPRTEPYVRLSRIRLPPRVCDGESGRIRSSAFVTRAWLWVQYVLCWCVFPLAPALRSTDSAAFAPADASAVGFLRFVRRLHCYYDEVRLLVSVHHWLRLLAFPMRTAVHTHSTRRRRPDTRSPRFRCDPFARDVALDPGRASAPRIAVPHMLPSSE